MSRLKFDIKFRTQIESGEYKVETRNGVPVKLLLINSYNARPIIGELELNGKTVYISTDESGSWTEGNGENQFDLFIITPEQELTEFEEAVKNIYAGYLSNLDDSPKFIKEKAAELLDLARKEFIKQGYVIEKKAFHDAVENIDDKHQVEMSVEYALYESATTRRAVMNWKEFQKVAQHFIDCGKSEALKDLPRWKPAAIAYEGNRLPRIDWSLNRLIARFEEGIFYIDINELYKLPGFKED